MGSEMCIRDRLLTCSTCKCEFAFDPDGHIIAMQRRHHFRATNPIQVNCYECNKQKNEYSCSRCGLLSGRKTFQKKIFVLAVQNGLQQCLECDEVTRGGVKCIMRSCNTFVPEKDLTAATKQHRKFVCAKCSAEGYTINDTKIYTCTMCKKVLGGRTLFQNTNFTQALQRNTVKCKTCHKEQP